MLLKEEAVNKTNQTAGAAGVRPCFAATNSTASAVSHPNSQRERPNHP